ncbi:hypothetical protein NIES4073_27450 [Kalymmatonema gypsitolerans NIES-4073]|nr:hypothetical protein NIES4073_27450 [Scytonema sp. NIES-4073]
MERSLRIGLLRLRGAQCPLGNQNFGDWRPSYKVGGLEAIRVNLSQNSSKISFPGLSRKCSLSGSAALKAEAEPPNGIPSQRLGTRQFSFYPTPVLSNAKTSWLS